MSLITCEVFIKVMSGLEMTLEEERRCLCLAALLCEQFLPIYAKIRQVFSMGGRWRVMGEIYSFSPAEKEK